MKYKNHCKNKASKDKIILRRLGADSFRNTLRESMPLFPSSPCRQEWLDLDEFIKMDLKLDLT